MADLEVITEEENYDDDDDDDDDDITYCENNDVIGVIYTVRGDADNLTDNDNNITSDDKTTNGHNASGVDYVISNDGNDINTNLTGADVSGIDTFTVHNHCASEFDVIDVGDNVSGDRSGDICCSVVGHNVIITCLKESFPETKIKISKMTALEKNVKMSLTSIPKDYRFATDIFNLVITNANGNTNLSTIKDNPPKKKYPVNKDTCTDSDFNIKVSIEPGKRHSFLEYSALVEMDSVWKVIPANYKDGCVDFSCSVVSSFAIIFRLQRRHLYVTPKGCQFGIDGTSLSLIFEKDSVASRQKVIYSIEEPKTDYLNDETESNQILNASERILFEFDKSKFSKPFTVVHKRPSATEEDQFTLSNVIFLGYRNDTPVVISTSPERNQDGNYIGKLQGYDGVTFLTMKTDHNESKHSLSLAENLDVIYGMKELCTLMLFYYRKENTTLYLRVECCLTKNKTALKRKNKDGGYMLIFQSEDLCLSTYQRIKVRPTCSIGVKPGQKGQFTLFFLSTSDDNSINLEVEIKKHLSGTPNAILEFSTDNKQNVEIARAEFRIDKLVSQKGQLKRPKSRKKNDGINNSQDTSNVPDMKTEEISDCYLDIDESRNVFKLTEVIDDNVDSTDETCSLMEQSKGDTELTEISPKCSIVRNNAHLNERYEQ